MPSAQHSVTIKRPIDEVFAFVADGGNARQWRPGVVDIQHASGIGVGAVYRQGVKGPGGRRIAADFEITAFQPNERIAFRAIAGPVRPNGEYRFALDGDQTTVTFWLEATLTGWKSLLMGRAVQATMDSEVRNLDTLKRILES
ncbi:MAG: SRPBCC family protein [Chloroflexota bacterium]|nr:SRPBCC family protein [Chloroflexota bacterium]